MRVRANCNNICPDWERVCSACYEECGHWCNDHPAVPRGEAAPASHWSARHSPALWLVDYCQHCGHNNNILMTWCQWQPITVKDEVWVTNERPELGSVSTFPCQLVAQLADNKSAYCDDHDTGPGNPARPHICLSKPKWDDDLIRTWEPVVCTQDPTLGYQGTAETVRQYPHLVYCRVNPVFLHITDHSSNKLRSTVSLQTENKDKRRGKYLHTVTFLTAWGLHNADLDPESPSC